MFDGLVARSRPPLGRIRHHLCSPPLSIDCGRVLIPGLDSGRKSECRQRVMLLWHHLSAWPIPAKQFAIAVFGHPLGPRQMGIMDLAASLRINGRIKFEQDLHGFAPIGPVAMSIEKPQVQGHVLTIIRSELLVLRRFIEKLRLSHADHQAPIRIKWLCRTSSVLALIHDRDAQKTREKSKTRRRRLRPGRTTRRFMKSQNTLALFRGQKDNVG